MSKPKHRNATEADYAAARQGIRACVTYACSDEEKPLPTTGKSSTALPKQRAPPPQRSQAPQKNPALQSVSLGEPLGSLEMLRGGTDADLWLSICPWLHVGDEKLLKRAREKAFRPKSQRIVELVGRLDEDGYFTVPPAEFSWVVDLQLVARGITTLVGLGLPAMCILAYDEPWAMAAQLEHLVHVTTGGCKFVFDWAAFCVRAGTETQGAAEAGWKPHRDRMSDLSATHGFRVNGSPKYVTFWTALTDATLESSCLMCVPRRFDPGYTAGDSRASPLDVVFNSAQQFQYIRPLPISAGGVIAFSHRLLHWGSAADPRAPAPRVAIAFAMADPDLEGPYLQDEALPAPSLVTRLALIVGLVITYDENERSVAGPSHLQFLYELFEEHKREDINFAFAETVRKKYHFKFYGIDA